MQLRQQEIDHVLLGWHRVLPVQSNVRIMRWLRDRAIMLSLCFRAKVPDGRHLAKQMINCGWLNLGPQIMPIKSKGAITNLKHYEPVFLQKWHKRETKSDDAGGELHIGMVDRRLRVRSLSLYTPTIPLYFGAHSATRMELPNNWALFLAHIEMQAKKSCGRFMCFDQDELDDVVVPKTLISIDYGKRHCFDMNGKKTSLIFYDTNPFGSSKVRARHILMPRHLTYHINHNVFNEDRLVLHICLNWNLEQIQIQDQKPTEAMFLNYDDDDDE